MKGERLSNPSTQYPVTTICGSMRYLAQMLQLASELTGRGYIVLMPFVAEYAGGRQTDDIKIMLDEMHRRKIDMSTSIHVVGSHIGESTTDEIAYARARRLPIVYVADAVSAYPPEVVPGLRQ